MRQCRTPRPSIIQLFVLAAFVAVTPPQAAHAGDERPHSVSVILSKLPDASSPAYRSIKDAAGSVRVETLEMTHAETWTFLSRNFDAVIAQAGRAGVTVKRIDERWNHTLMPMPSGASISEEQRDMMHQAMQSKAAMAVSMMVMQEPAAMERALTMEMNASGQDQPPAILVIPLNDTLSVRARRTGIIKNPDSYTWHGVIESSGEHVTLMWWPEGRLSGQLSYGGRMYSIKNMSGGMHGVIEMSPKRLPPQHAPMDLGLKQKMRIPVDPLIREGDASRFESMMEEATRSPETTTPGRRGATEDAQPRDKLVKEATVLPIARAPLAASPPSPGIAITLIVAYTKKAARHYSDIKRDLIALAIAEANASLANSGIHGVSFVLAHAYETGYIESGSHFDHAFQFLRPDDGLMDEVHALRNQLHGDIAVLIVDDDNGCGLSARVAAPADRAFAAVHHECAALTYSLAHELGHIIGARHDLGLDDSAEPFPFGHGFVNGTAWRTMMSYEESCGGCPRLPVWSNPEITIEGVAVGDDQSNNARVLRERASLVAAFR